MITETEFMNNVFSNLQFKVFTQNDWYAYSGCESKFPLISYFEYEGMGYESIIDNGSVSVYAMDEMEYFYIDLEKHEG